MNPSTDLRNRAVRSRKVLELHRVDEDFFLEAHCWRRETANIGDVRDVLLGAKHSFQALPQLRVRRSQVRPQLDQGSTPTPLTQQTELGH
jgi:hypothetical protein